MVIDSSAVLAVLLGENDGQHYSQIIESAENAKMSTVSLLEVTLVIGARKRENGITLLNHFLLKSGIEIIAFDFQQLLIAKDAWWQFGKGRHPAALNLGDCCSYALAKSLGRPLLYKGGDFPQTDINGVDLPERFH